MNNEIKKKLDSEFNIVHRVALANRADHEQLGRKLDYMEAHAFMASLNVPEEWIDIPVDADIRLEDRSWKPKVMFILHSSMTH